MENSKKLTLKEFAEDDKPREKMIAKGKKSLTNAELLAILIGSGTPGINAIELAQNILNSCDNRLARLSRLEIKDLTKNFSGIGTAKAVTIIAALELGYRLLSENISLEQKNIRNSEDLFNYVSSHLLNLDHEECWAVFLNVKGRVIFEKQISSGGWTETSVDVKMIFKIALENSATSVCLIHNHPSGDVQPSGKDDMLTRRLVDGGKLLGIHVIEHLIVGVTPQGRPTYFSYCDSGRL